MASRRGEKSQRCGQPWVAPPKTKRHAGQGLSSIPDATWADSGPFSRFQAAGDSVRPNTSAERVCSFSSGSLMGLGDRDAMRCDEEKRTKPRHHWHQHRHTSTCRYHGPATWWRDGLCSGRSQRLGRFWDSGILGLWDSGTLRFWDSGILGGAVQAPL